jgi:hypothetical protein
MKIDKDTLFYIADMTQGTLLPLGRKNIPIARP